MSKKVYLRASSSHHLWMTSVPLGLCLRSIACFLRRWRHCANCIVSVFAFYWITSYCIPIDSLISCLFLDYNLQNRTKASKGFEYPSEMDPNKTGRVTQAMLGVLLTSPDSFDSDNLKGNRTSKTMSNFRFSETVDSLVKHMLGTNHGLYEANIVKYMTTTAQAQNLAFFIRSSVCAIIVKKEDILKENPFFVKVVAALTQWMYDGIDAASEKVSTLKADLYAVTMYNKRGMHLVLTHRCIKTLYKCSIDIQR